MYKHLVYLNIWLQSYVVISTPKDVNPSTELSSAWVVSSRHETYAAAELKAKEMNKYKELFKFNG